MHPYIIYLLFFFSGATGLIYQLVWARKLALLFGNTTYATSAILTAFMGGLALGSFLIGRYADRIKRPLRLYGKLELGIGAAALAILFLLIPISDAVYVWLFHHIGSSPLVINIFRFILAVFILIIPTTLMGGTLPVISKYFIQKSEEFGRGVGRLYSFNTFGAVIGAFITGYFLIGAFGVRTTLWLAIVLNLIIGAVALWLDGRKPQHVPEKPKKSDSAKSQPAQPTGDKLKISAYSAPQARLMLWLFGLAGFASLAYEVVWTRALIFFISSTTYSFTIILTTFLVGIALGSAIMARPTDHLKRLFFWFGAFELIIAIAAIASVPLLGHLNAIQSYLVQQVQSQNWTQISLLLFLSTFLILIIPTLFMGAVFPIVNRIYVDNLKTVGQGVGKVYTANTIGAILGSFISGFILLPVFGMNGSILALGLINLAIGLVSLFSESAGRQRKRATFLYAGIPVLAFAAILIIGFSTKPLFISGAGFKDTRLLHYKDTAAATVSVLEKKDQVNIWGKNVRYLNVNGHNTAHTTYSDMIIHKLLAHLPVLLTPDPREVLVVGFGFGNTCKSFLEYDFIKKVDCVELVEHEKKTAAFFEDENKGVLQDDRFRFIVSDGRNYILAADATYDIISINSVDPKFSPTLYTEEFYRLVRKRLNANGQLVAWLPIYGMNLDEVRALVKSFIDVFPEAELWYNNPEHLLLVGKKGNYPIDVESLKHRMMKPRIWKSLEEIHLNDPYTFLANFFCGRQMLSKFAGDVQSHSDNHPVVEFSRITSKEMIPEVYRELLNCRETVLLYSMNFDALGETETVRKQILNYEREMKNLMAAFFNYRLFAARPEAQETLVEIIATMQKILNEEPANDFALMQYVDLLSHGDMVANQRYFDAAIAIAPNFAKAYVLSGLAHAAKQEWDLALASYQRALAINPAYFTAKNNAGLILIQQQKWAEAEQIYRTLLQENPDDSFAHSTIAQVYYMLENYDAAILHMKIAIETQPEQANLYFNLGRMYHKQGHIPEAIQAMEEGLKISPYDQRAIQFLEELKRMK
ncbi:MAG: fused MFS/spermidine synthase [Candidatus Zhuqueibacterota bacterium]